METWRQETFYPSVVAAGLLAGLRSFSAPAAVSSALAGQAELAAQVAPALRLLAAGEMVADKLPFMPDRTSPPILASRVLLGAGAGVVVALAYGRSWVAAAAIAGAAAAAGSYAGLALRRALGERLGLPDQLVALAEDAAVIGVGRALA
ncbi:MAG TPA: hypothetical protein PKD53_17820 [Chloroflexaceae bacterium]|nr:hypothetical protein [Chloroflexaceae bacterium]